MCFTPVTSLICFLLLRLPTKGRVPLTGQTERHMWLLEIKLIPHRLCPMCHIKRSSLEGQIHFVLLWKEYLFFQDTLRPVAPLLNLCQAIIWKITCTSKRCVGFYRKKDWQHHNISVSVLKTLWNMDVICVRASLSPSWHGVCRLHETVVIPASSFWAPSSFTKKMLWQGGLYEMETELELYFYISVVHGVARGWVQRAHHGNVVPLQHPHPQYPVIAWLLWCISGNYRNGVMLHLDLLDSLCKFNVVRNAWKSRGHLDKTWLFI